jgi:translation initiation factor 4E
MAAAATEATNLDQQVDLSTIPISPKGAENGSEAADDSKPVTVFHDKDNFNVKHPLQNKWTLWFTKPPSGKVCGHLTWKWLPMRTLWVGFAATAKL